MGHQLYLNKRRKRRVGTLLFLELEFSVQLMCAVRNKRGEVGNRI